MECFDRSPCITGDGFYVDKSVKTRENVTKLDPVEGSNGSLKDQALVNHVLDFLGYNICPYTFPFIFVNCLLLDCSNAHGY